MKKTFLNLFLIVSLSFFAGCATSTGPRSNISDINKVALVSLSISDWGGSVRAGSVGTTPVAELISNTAVKMLHDTEKKLNNRWSVVNASSFVNKSAYRDLSSQMLLSVIVPEINGNEMAVFTDVSSEIKGGIIEPKTAMDLCQALNVDGIVLVFSEWTARTGGVVPLTKAVTKNVFTIWDSNGQLVVKKRVDMMGRKALGFSGFKAINENTISEWQDSFNKAMDKIINSI